MTHRPSNEDSTGPIGAEFGIRGVGAHGIGRREAARDLRGGLVGKAARDTLVESLARRRDRERSASEERVDEEGSSKHADGGQEARARWLE